MTLTDWQEGSDACRRKEIQVRMEAVRKKVRSDPRREKNPL